MLRWWCTIGRRAIGVAPGDEVSMLRKRCGWLLLGLAVFCTVPVATASRVSAQTESDDDAARRHFRLGQAHYENGEFAEAATEFDEAYRLSQRPQLLYNIYVAYRDAGDMPHAARALRSYLELVENPENGAQLRARLVAMERVLGSSGTTTTTDTTTDTATDTTSTDTTSTDTSASDTATDTTSTATSSDTTSSSDTTTSSSSDTESGGGSGGGFGSSPVGWIVGGVGAAAMIAGIVTGVMALDAQSTLDNQCGPDHHSCPAGFESTQSTGQALGAATDGLLIGGGVALAAGVVLLFLLTDGGASDAPPVSASCGPTGCSAFVQGSF